MTYRIFETQDFDNDFEKLEKFGKERVEKLLIKISESDGNVGKALRKSILKEKKFNGNRLYFLVYENFNVILAVKISDKKTQQATIEAILIELEHYRQFVIDQLRKT
ncbi:MAG: hypothetical protein Q7S21_05135 [archaeon]|nr:hypothetical protein [archaeon]